MEQIKSPIQAIDDDILEQVSGGTVQEDINLSYSAYLTFANIGNLIINEEVATLIQGKADELLYRNVINTAASYDKSKKPVSEKLDKFISSWQKSNPNGGEMSIQMASMILGLGEYPVLRAKLICMPDTTQIANALNEIYSS